MPKKSTSADFTGWVAEDYLAEILVELRRANAMRAGYGLEVTHDDAAGPVALEKLLTLGGDVKRKGRGAGELVRVSDVNTANRNERDKP